MVSPYFHSAPAPADFVPFPPEISEWTLSGRFNQVAALIPQKIAVSDHARALSYATLQQLAAGTAAIIQREMSGPRPARAIGMIFDPSVESVVGIMGVLLSGHFFCPISPNDPPELVRNYLQDADIELILTTRVTLPERLQPTAQQLKTIFIEDIATQPAVDASLPAIDPDHLGALLYSSGSTGRPKGVTHTHRTLVQMVRIKGHALTIAPSDKLAGLSSFTFGTYYWNVFATLLFGATLHLFDFYRFPFSGLRSWLLDRHISVIHCTPTILRQFMDTLTERTTFPALRVISLGGEMLYPQDVRRFQELINGDTQLRTTGATIETFFYASTYFADPLPDDIDELPLGFLDPGNIVEIHDENGAVLATGETGEITVASEALSPGYWKRPELNKEKYFVARNGKRYFCSGDLGVIGPDGLLYYKGRLDFQIKVRGMRVDLGEIEAVLHEHPGIKQAVVAGRADNNSDTEVIAYLIKQPGSTVRRRELYEYLTARLSPYQVPRRLVFVDSFPLTRTHKVDRKALPAPEEVETEDDVELVAPRDEFESAIHGIWASVLGQTEFGVTDHFLEIGGDSLQAMHIHARIKKELGWEIPLREFFNTETIGALAELFRKERQRATIIDGR